MGTFRTHPVCYYFYEQIIQKFKNMKVYSKDDNFVYKCICWSVKR